jgi:hypothetical protein
MPPAPKTTTAIATATKPASPSAKRPAIRATNMEYIESLKAYADVLFRGGLAPKGVSRPEGVAAIIEVGRDVGLSDTQALANVMIVGGRASIWGDAGMALIRNSGLLEDIEETYEGDPDSDEFAAVCKITRKGANRPRTERYSVADAKLAKLWGKAGPWQTSPRRQLMWRAKGFATRDEFQDVLCGLIFREEADDYPTTEPAAGTKAAKAKETTGPRTAIAEDVKTEPLTPGRLNSPKATEPADDDASDKATEETVAEPNEPVATATTATGEDTESPRQQFDRDQILASIIDLKEQWMTKHGANTKDKIKMLWTDVIKPFGVQSILDMNDSELGNFYEYFVDKVVPF